MRAECLLQSHESFRSLDLRSACGNLRRVSSVTIAFSPGELNKPAFDFRSASYWHRWSNNDQHEFTPRGQEDLQRWSDMVTINLYPEARDGEALAMTANAVLGNYNSHQAIVLKTDSVPGALIGLRNTTLLSFLVSHTSSRQPLPDSSWSKAGRAARSSIRIAFTVRKWATR